jgi:hypothetical protein
MSSDVFSVDLADAASADESEANHECVLLDAVRCGG